MVRISATPKISGKGLLKKNKNIFKKISEKKVQEHAINTSDVRKERTSGFGSWDGSLKWNFWNRREISSGEG